MHRYTELSDEDKEKGVNTKYHLMSSCHLSCRTLLALL